MDEQTRIAHVQKRRSLAADIRVLSSWLYSYCNGLGDMSPTTSDYANLSDRTARLAEYLEAFVLELEQEVKGD